MRTVGWFVVDVSGDPICLRFKGQDVTDKMSRNVADIRAYSTQEPKRAEISTTMRLKPKMSLNVDRYLLSL